MIYSLEQCEELARVQRLHGHGMAPDMLDQLVARVRSLEERLMTAGERLDGQWNTCNGCANSAPGCSAECTGLPALAHNYTHEVVK